MIGEIDGVKIIATPEQYKNSKKSLEEQLEEKDKEIERLNNTINRIQEDLKTMTLEFKPNHTIYFEVKDYAYKKIDKLKEI